jgi:hypothetical protein
MTIAGVEKNLCGLQPLCPGQYLTWVNWQFVPRTTIFGSNSHAYSPTNINVHSQPRGRGE